MIWQIFTIDKKRICDKIPSVDAGIAHPVERHLAKVEVASSSLVARSKKNPAGTARRIYMAP